MDEARLLPHRGDGLAGRAVGDGDEADAVRQQNGALIQVVEQRLVLAQDDELCARAECHLQQRGVFEIDIQQIGDAADDRVPRRMRRRACPVEDVFHADAESLLPQFQIFEQTLPCEGRTALFALLTEPLLGLVLFAEQ